PSSTYKSRLICYKSRLIWCSFVQRQGIQLFCTELPGQTRCDIRRKTICRRQLDLTIRPALQKTNNFASALIYWLKTSVQVQQIKVARRQGAGNNALTVIAFLQVAIKINSRDSQGHNNAHIYNFLDKHLTSFSLK
ncbi:TPA: hypothetical protein ACOEP1_004908, partial [Enterobacter kobei]